MASFGREIFPIIDAEGAPRTGLASSIIWLSIYSVNSSGTATQVTVSGDKPAFSEIGTTGIYIVGAGANNGAIPADTRLVGFIDCGTGSVPRYRYFDSKYSDRQEPALYTDVSILADGTNGLAAIKTQTGTIATDTGLIKGYTNGGSGSAYALLTSGTYGLSVIKTSADSAASNASTAATNASSASTAATNAYDIVNNGTYGNSALNTLLTDGTNGLAAIKTSAASAASSAGTASTAATNAYNIVNSGTYGNSAIQLQLTDVQTAANDASTAAQNAETYSLTAKKHLTNKIVTDTTTNQMKVYDDDGTTVIRTFNLLNSTGVATSTNVFRRVPV